MELQYDSLENEIFEALGESKLIVLATSYKDKVTARSMSCLIYNKRIYFQTSTAFEKYEQLSRNPKVALCVNNIAIEGIAHIKKHPFAETEFAVRYKEKHSSSYDAYSHMRTAVVIEVEPTFVTLWKYENGQPFRDFLDCIKKCAYREIYDTSN